VTRVRVNPVSVSKMKEKYKKKEKTYTKAEMRSLYEKDPAKWLLLFSGGKHGKPEETKKK